MKNTHDGTNEAPRLRIDLVLGTTWLLPEWSTGPRVEGRPLYEAIREAGYAGVQGGDPELCAQVGLASTGMGRVDRPEEAEAIGRKRRDQGHECVTLHVGLGIESDERAHALIEAVLEASDKLDFPMYVETHRATITQDIYRTVQFVERYPSLRFNGDFSHWYTGLEMVYGPIEERLAFAAPVFERVRFLHGRIGSSGCIQVDVGDGIDRPHVAHFRDMWTRSFRGFLADAKPGDYICFCPELLPPFINYARTFPDADGQPREESDRWAQAQVLAQIARECFAAAQAG